MPPDGTGTPSGTWDTDSSAGWWDAVLRSTGQFPQVLKRLTSRDAILWNTVFGLPIALGAVRYLTRK
jgi:hypothetical protein